MSQREREGKKLAVVWSKEDMQRFSRSFTCGVCGFASPTTTHENAMYVAQLKDRNPRGWGG